jgi:hypothetical protein
MTPETLGLLKFVVGAIAFCFVVWCIFRYQA